MSRTLKFIFCTIAATFILPAVTFAQSEIDFESLDLTQSATCQAQPDDVRCEYTKCMEGCRKAEEDAEWQCSIDFSACLKEGWWIFKKSFTQCHYELTDCHRPVWEAFKDCKHRCFMDFDAPDGTRY